MKTLLAGLRPMKTRPSTWPDQRNSHDFDQSNRCSGSRRRAARGLWWSGLNPRWGRKHSKKRI